MSKRIEQLTALIRAALWPAAVAGVILTATCFYLGGADWLRDQPIGFEGDAVFFYAYASVVKQSGWNWVSADLGMPFGFNLIAFPQNLTVDTLWMLLWEMTTDNSVAILNRTWATNLCLSGVLGYFALSILGLRKPIAAVLSVLFALTPYAFYRNVGHFNLHYAMIALPIAASILTACGEISRISRRRFIALLVACVALGFGYVYYSVFACFTLASGVAIRGLRSRNWRIQPRSLALLIAIVVATGINLTPSISEWHKNGRPEDMDYKNVSEADVYALRIRDLILPDRTSPIGFMRVIGDWNTKTPWPDNNERNTAKIGTVASIGLFLAFVLLLGAKTDGNSRLHDRSRCSAYLILALLLLSVQGGFGSIFNLYIAPDIRAYNRVAPFLALLALFILGNFLQRLAFRRSNHSIALPIAASLTLAFGIIDQDVSQPRREIADHNREASLHLSRFVSELEATIPHGSQVYMLPVTSFPPDHVRIRMEPYDHAKPTLYSTSLRWSWPVFGLKNSAWQRSLGSPSSTTFYAKLRASGFDHVWLDCFGFADGGTAIKQTIAATGAQPVLIDDRGRYIVYRLPERSSNQAWDDILDPVTAEFRTGFHQAEINAQGIPFRWATTDAEIVLRNGKNTLRHLMVTFDICGLSEMGEVRITVGKESRTVALSINSSHQRLGVEVPGNGRVSIRFQSNAPRAAVPDSRDIRFGIFSFTLEPAKQPDSDSA